MAAKEKVGLGGLRNRLFLRLVRTRVQQELQAKGHTKEEAAELVNHLHDETILEIASKKKVKAPEDGGFLDWIKSHLSSIAPLIEALVAILAMFATPNPSQGTTPAPTPPG